MTELAAAIGLCWHPREARVLGPVDLRLHSGEVVAIVGPNGAGKSTMLRLVAGLLPPTAGRVRWRGGGPDTLSRREIARRVAYLPQNRSTAVPLPVNRFVELARYAHWRGGQPGRSDREITAAALDRVGLTELGDRPLASLSGGERQMAFFAAVLAQRAELWILDEPTNHLDPRHQRDLIRLVREEHRDGGLAVLFATHDLNLAATLATRVIALSAGRRLAEGPPREILDRTTLEELFAAPFQIDPGSHRVWLELP